MSAAASNVKLEAASGSSAELMEEYRALTQAVGVVDLPARTQIEICGRDRAKFLNGFCTNDVLRLTSGTGCEAFFTNVKGRIVGHGCIFCSAEALVVETVPGQAERLVAHLDRYLVREDVQLVDRSSEWSELLVGGPDAELLLGRLAAAPPPRQELAHAAAQLAGVPVVLRRVGLIGGPAWLVGAAAADVAAVRSQLLREGVRACSAAAFEVARVEAGWPHYGQDISEENLPQEVDRNDRAISFRKGCYLGQETVARLDALGHVNRTLAGVRLAAEQVPPVGLELLAAGQVAGRVTSAVWSVRFQAPWRWPTSARAATARASNWTAAWGRARWWRWEPDPPRSGRDSQGERSGVSRPVLHPRPVSASSRGPSPRFNPH